MELSNIPFTKLSSDDISRPWLPVTIINHHSNKKVKVLGLIDTGADECALPASYAAILGPSSTLSSQILEFVDELS